MAYSISTFFRLVYIRLVGSKINAVLRIFQCVNFKIRFLPCNILKLVCITFGNVRIFMKGTDGRGIIHDPLFQNLLEDEEGNVI
jgi:hypothetical protein